MSSMSSTPSSPSSSGPAPPPPPSPLSAQHFSFMERDLFADFFSPLTRSRQDRLLATSVVSLLLSMGVVQAANEKFTFFGFPLRSAADAEHVKFLVGAVVLSFLVMFIAGAVQDLLSRRAVKLGIEGRLDDTQNALSTAATDYLAISNAIVDELYSLPEKQKELAQQPGRTAEEANRQLEDVRRRIPALIKKYSGVNQEQANLFESLGDRLQRFAKTLKYYFWLETLIVSVDLIFPLVLAGVALWRWWSG